MCAFGESYRAVRDWFERQSSACKFCCGFYGESHGQPVCSTCHAFLFQDDVTANLDCQPADTAEKSDSSDSGNEEPQAASDFYTHRAAAPGGEDALTDHLTGEHLASTSASQLPSLGAGVSTASEGAAEVVGLVASISVNAASGTSKSQSFPPMSEAPLKKALKKNSVQANPQTNPHAAPATLSCQRNDQLIERVQQLCQPRNYDRENYSDVLLRRLPPEVLLSIFGEMEDYGLLSARMVCRQWQELIDHWLGDDYWMETVHKRWPLFKAHYTIKDWRSVFYQLIRAAPCHRCLCKMLSTRTQSVEDNSWRHCRLRSELKATKTDPTQGIEACPLDKKCSQWMASVLGPANSPYEGGKFFLHLQIPYNYPMSPPVIRFLTKIFHPNVSRHGDVGIDSVAHNWSLALTIAKVLISVQSLLTDPCCHTSMEPEIAELLQRDRPAFNRLARVMTWRYAMVEYISHKDIQALMDIEKMNAPTLFPVTRNSAATALTDSS